MRRSRRMAVAALSVAATAAGCELVAGLGDYVSQSETGDATLAADASDAGPTTGNDGAPDAASADAGSGCEAATWCGCHTPPGGYCLDFDEPGPSAFGVFQTYDSLGDAALLGPNSATSTSPPDSLLVSFAPNTQNFTNVLLQSTVGSPVDGGPITFDVAFDFQVDVESAAAAGPLYAQVVNVGIAGTNDLGGPPQYNVWFGLDDQGNVRVGDYVSATGRGQNQAPVPPPPPPATGTWHHVTMTVTFTGLDAGELDFALDDAGSRASLSPSVVSGNPFLKIGVAYADQNLGVTFRLDDVTVVVR